MSINNEIEPQDYTTVWQRFTPEVAWGTLALLAGVILAYLLIGFAIWHNSWHPAFSFIALVITAYASFTVLHEAGHGNIFQATHPLKSLEPYIGWLSCVPLLVFPYRAFKVIHDRHHAFTNNPDLDPDYYGEINSWGEALQHSFMIPYYYYRMCAVTLVDEPEVKAALRNTHYYLAILFSIYTTAIVSGLGVELLLYVIAPAVVTLVILTFFFDYIPHQPHRSLDRHRNTRVFVGFWYNVLLLGQNFHLMHHMFPRLPWYQYRRVFHTIEEDLIKQQAPIENLMGKDYPTLFESSGGDSYLNHGEQVNMLLRVKSMRQLTNDATLIEFKQANGGPLKFHAGQYLVLSKLLDGHYHQRCYSLCSAPSDHSICIAVKNTGGTFSRFLNHELQVGDDILVQGPYGDFHLLEAGLNQTDAKLKNQTSSPELVLIGAGSGITPLLSILRQAHKQNPERPVTLIYANHSVTDIMFADELQQLSQHKTNFSYHAVISQLSNSDSTPEYRQGRLSSELLQQLLFDKQGSPAVRHYYICGPAGVQKAALQCLKTEHVDDKTIFVEAFIKSPTKPLGKIYQVEVESNGRRQLMAVAENQTLLEVAQQKNIYIPNACGEGMCGSCKITVSQGQVSTIAKHCPGLLPEEQAAGVSLACQCKPRSDLSISARF